MALFISAWHAESVQNKKKIVILILSSSKMLTVLLVVLSIVTLCDWKVPFSSSCLNGYT